ncbi:MAG: hypothetical protein M1825_005979 [Sarcosagium campestre]|nr:MAG: hypothetical protein M1825_005979 [Sarcosagium campestre]
MEIMRESLRRGKPLLQSSKRRYPHLPSLGRFNGRFEELIEYSVGEADVRQCLIYDTPARNARLIGVEYMITPRIYETLDAEERRLWHSHVFEVKSGMLILPKPSAVPEAVWEAAETKEMEQVVGLYGKTYHLWQVDRGDLVPLEGVPQLMMSFTKSSQLDMVKELQERDDRFGVDRKHKAEIRKDVEEPSVHEDADSMWKGKDAHDQ